VIAVHSLRRGGWLVLMPQQLGEDVHVSCARLPFIARFSADRIAGSASSARERCPLAALPTAMDAAAPVTSRECVVTP
jgi:hypothetical protein